MTNYDAKIDAQYQMIANCNQQIAVLEEQIADLRRASAKLDDVAVALSSASRKEGNRFDAASAALGVARSVTRKSVFSGLIDIITGSRYQSAVNEIREAKDSIENKIVELQRQIAQLQQNITGCYRNIDNLKAEKAAEIRRERERREREAAEAAREQ